MYFVKAPFLLRKLYPDLTWNMNRNVKRLYITFDDGPIPIVTDEIRNVLNTFEVPATFFCVGENLSKNPQLYEKLKSDGHQIGNHSFNHLNGWKTPTEVYIENIEKCEGILATKLFRPPYSKITRAQTARLQQLGYKIIMWDVVSGDFDARIQPEKCLQNVLKNASNGSIIVFHDHEKAWERLSFTLPRALEHWLSEGYSFGTLS